MGVWDVAADIKILREAHLTFHISVFTFHFILARFPLLPTLPTTTHHYLLKSARHVQMHLYHALGNFLSEGVRFGLDMK